MLTGVDGPASARLRAGGVPVEVLGAFRLGAPARLARTLALLAPDVLHLHGSRSGLAGAMAAGRVGIDAVVYTAHAFSFHRPWPEFLRWIAARAEARTCATASRVICLTRGDLDAAARRGIDTRRFVVIPNGIDPSRFPAAAERRDEWQVPPAAPVVGMVARLVPQKDPAVFVAIARRVIAEVPEARFVLVGDGPLRADVEAAGADLIRGGVLRLAGVRHDVPEVLATMDVMVFPSLWEGLPLTLLEAMAAARPLVASVLPGHAEVIESGVNGVLAPARDPEAFAREVVALLRDPARRRELGARARATVLDRYTLEGMVERTLAVYRVAVSATA